MTRESLAKDILIALLPKWTEALENEERADWKDPIQTVAKTSVTLADALLEALGTTEPPASWLSKEMQKTGTPAGSFPVLRGADWNTAINAAKAQFVAGVLSPAEYGEEITRIMREAAHVPAPCAKEDAWEPRIGDVVKWNGCRRACTVETVKAGPTRSWTLIKERKGERRTYVVKEVSGLVPYELEEDEE